MLNREERRGLLWITLFVVVILGLLVTFMVVSDPLSHPPRTAARTDRTELSLGRLDGEVYQAFTQEPLLPEVRVLGLGGLSSHWLEEPALDRPEHFLLNGLPASTDFTVEVGAPGCEVRSFTARVLPDRVTHLGKIPLRPLVRVAARVRSGAGKAIAGVGVELHAGGELLQTHSTDADGLARFDPLPADRFVLDVSGGGWTGAHPVACDARHPLGGQPLELTAARRLPLEVLFTGDEPPDTVQFRGRATSGEAGRFLVGGLPAGETWGLATGPAADRTLFLASLPGPGLRIPLPAAEEWRVFIEGEPGPVWLAARTTLREATSMAQSVSGATAVSGAGEETSLRLRSAGQAVEFLAVNGSGALATASVPAAARAGPREIHLRLEPAGASASIPANSTLRLFPWGDLEAQGVLLEEGATVAALDAGLLLAEVPLAKAGGGSLRASTTWLAAHGSDLARWPPLQGIVLGAGDRPAASARVSTFVLVDGVPQLLATTFTQEDGTFSLERPDPALDASLLVEASGFARGVQRPGDARKTTVRLEREASLSLKLVGEDGAPLDGGAVLLRFAAPWADLPLAPAARDAGMLQCFADAAGELVVPGLAAGAPPSVEPAGRLSGVLDRPLPALGAGEVAGPVTLHCYGPHSFAGSILDAAGRPVAGATVELQVPPLYLAHAPGPCTTTPSGSFAWTGVPPPPWSIRVAASGFAPRTVTLSSVPDGPYRVVLEPAAPPP